MTDALTALYGRTRSLSDGLEALIRDAYEAGFREGGLAMRDHILQAANAPVSIKAGAVQMATTVTPRASLDLDTGTSGLWPDKVPVTPDARRKATRAPRGLVRAAVAEVLRQQPGLSITEIEERVVALHPEIARKSIGNQLRHFEDDLYRREGKYNWFLMGEPQKETASPALPADLAELLGPLKGGEAQ
ncbi:hypothetical protein [Brevundimonas sp.]|uniref:hypothetical protein n=1 Tax=Brevundimonas sp. TaxID=1871086 RepID=UPI003F72078B